MSNDAFPIIDLDRLESASGARTAPKGKAKAKLSKTRAGSGVTLVNSGRGVPPPWDLLNDQ